MSKANRKVTLEFFSPPNGEDVENPKLEWLKDLILYKGKTFWNAGAGQGALTRKEDGKESQLVITMDPKYGFYLQFSIRNEE